MTDLLESLTLEDLREQDRELAELVGIEGFKRLVEVYGGTTRLYIPLPEMVVLPCRNALLKREYNGYNTLELAKKYNLAERTVYTIVKEKDEEIKKRPPEGQVTFEEAIDNFL